MPVNNSSTKTQKVRKLLVIDMSYSLEVIRECGIETSVTCRDLDGFFEHVWTIHPFATLVTSKNWTSRYGKPEWHSLAPAHTFIEGKVGRFPVLHRLSVLNFLISQIDIILRLVRLIYKEKISVIRTADPLYNGLLGWVLSRLSNIPLVVRVGSNSDKNYELTGLLAMPRLFKKRWVEKIVERFVLARTNLVACANKDYMDFAIANGARPEVVTLFRYGNLIAKQHLVKPSNRPDGRPLLIELGVEPRRFLLTISRLVPLKHLEDVVRVLAELKQRGHDLKLVLVGDGPLRETLSNLAEQLGVMDQTILCGNQDQEWLARIIPLAAVVVSPITGRSLTETAFGAAPIVAYDLDWQGELIQTGITGELVPALELKKMADATERFLTKPSYASDMGEAVRKRALEMMDPDALDQHERNAYQNLLNEAN